MGLVRNLKKTLNNLVDKILVELSSAYIKQLAKQTSKKQDNSLSMESLPNPLTQEDQHTIIATSSADTSERITMMKPYEEALFNHIRDWAINRVEEFNGKDVSQIYDQLALIDEFHEWMDPKSDLEIISLDEISEEEYDSFVDGIERA